MRRTWQYVFCASTAYCVAWFVLSSKIVDREALRAPSRRPHPRIADLDVVCDSRWSRAELSVARLAADVARRGTVLAVAVDGTAPPVVASQIERLSRLLSGADGGRVVLGVATTTRATWAAATGVEVVAPSSAIEQVSSEWMAEALARNQVLDALNHIANVSAVLLCSASALWCAGDALRLVAQLGMGLDRGADVACATGATEEADVVDPNPGDDSTCNASLRRAGPTDAWTGDLVAVGAASRARVLSCWSDLVAVRASHLAGESVPPVLRFRPPVSGECAGPPSTAFVLDVHRRVQTSMFGAKAVVVADGGALVGSLRDLATSSGQSPPPRVDLVAAADLDEPAQMPSRFRCCVAGTCSWQPTLLDRVEGNSTAEALTRTALRRPPSRRLAGGDVIPRQIWQTFSRDKLPSGIAKAAQSWIDLNPTFRYARFNDTEVREYVERHYSAREVAALVAAPSGAHRADLWRYLVVAREGGVYADVDSVCDAPIDDWLRPSDAGLVVALNGPPRFDASQWAFAAPPGHPVLIEAASIATDNLLRSSNKSTIPFDVYARVGLTRGLRRVPDGRTASGFAPDLRFDCPHVVIDPANEELLSGPPVLQAAIERVAARQAHEANATTRSTLAELVTLRPPYFGGAVRPKYTAEGIYLLDLASAGVMHWSLRRRGRRRQRRSGFKG